MPKKIFFDLGNVLIDVDKQKAVELFAQEFKLGEEGIKKIADSSLEKKFAEGKIGIDDYIDQLNNIFNNAKNELTLQRVKEIWKHPFTKIDSTENILDSLRGQTDIFLLSNTNPLHILAVKEKYPALIPKFQKKIYSYDAGTSKPDQKIYEYALERTGVKPENSIFIDDLEENVDSARELGFYVHQYHNQEELINFLQRHDFDVTKI